MIKLNLLKYGKKYAVTFSYDDGSVHDERLIDIFNKNGIKATFHLNTGRQDMNPAEIYKGHEISCHGVEHAAMKFLPTTNIINEIFENRRELESYAGYPVCGLSYAWGSYSQNSLEALKSCGIVYSRTVHSTYGFEFPEDWLQWNPTCHHKVALEMIEKFKGVMDYRYYWGPQLLYIWGHSHEFESKNNWELIEQACSEIGGDDRIWYATNMEIYRYMKAARSLVVSADNKMVYNPSAETIWFSDSGEDVLELGTVYEIKSGETLYLK